MLNTFNVQGRYAIEIIDNNLNLSVNILNQAHLIFFFQIDKQISYMTLMPFFENINF